nr:DNA-directed DNA polymerase [Tanacetum cinerariifolium]
MYRFQTTFWSFNIYLVLLIHEVARPEPNIPLRANLGVLHLVLLIHEVTRLRSNIPLRPNLEYDKEPPTSILTWEDLVNKFVNQFFPPSKTTHLRNEISRFTQRFEETFGEAWEQFKEILRVCPHHRFTELAQIDTFYNGLNDNDQDSLNAATGGNLLSKTTIEALKIIKNKSKVRYSRNKPNVSRMNTTSRDNASKSDDRIDKLMDQISTLVDIFAKKIVTPASVKAVEESCGGNHAYYNCPNTDSNQPSVCVATGTYNQVAPQNHSSNFMAPPGFAPVQNSQIGEFKNKIQNTMKTQQTVLIEQKNAFQNNLQNMLSGFFENESSTSSTLPSNTIPNPKDEMKAITTLSGVAYEGPSIPTPKKVVERETEEITDKEQSNFQGSTAHIQPPVTPILEPDVPKTLPKPKIPYPSTHNDQKLSEKATNQIKNDAPQKASRNLGDPGKFLIPCDFSGMDVCHALADLGASINPMLLFIWNKLSLHELTPTRMTSELADRYITRPKRVVEYVFVKVGKFHFPTDFVVVDFEADPRVPLILGRSFLRIGRALIDVYGEEITLRVNEEAVTFNLNQTTRYSSTYDDVLQVEVVKAKSSIEEPSKLGLKELPSHLEYVYLEGVDKLPVIISKDLKVDEKESLLKVLKSHKRAIAWKITDVKGIDPSPWVSPIHCVPKKGGITVVKNENNALIPTRLVTGWRVCIDYRKLNNATCKDHFPLLFMNQMLKRLARNEFYCFLDGFSGYFQIPINLPDQEKTTFTCPYGTFAYRRMPFGLCNAPRTFQRCMMAIFQDMIEKTIEVFMDDFLVFGDSFSSCLSHLDTMLQSRLFVKWVEAKALPTNDARVVVKFLKSLFAQFGTPRAIISDRGTHFCNDKFAKVMSKYGVTHRLSTAYHPQTSGQVEVSNQGLKRILKRTIG